MSRDESLPTAKDALTYQMDDDETASEAVVNAVAAASGCQRVRSFDSDSTPALEPLYSVIDPDAVDTLFEQTERKPAPTEWQLSFSFHGYDVRVTSDGVIELSALDW